MKVRTKIQFEFDSDDIEMDYFLTPDEFEDYAKDCMSEDIYKMVKHNELYNYIKVEVI